MKQILGLFLAVGMAVCAQAQSFEGADSGLSDFSYGAVYYITYIPTLPSWLVSPVASVPIDNSSLTVPDGFSISLSSSENAVFTQAPLAFAQLDGGDLSLSPEPSTLALMGLGGAFAAWCLRRSR